MGWMQRFKVLLSSLLAAILPTEQLQPFRLDEGPDSDQPHTHEEAREPEENADSEDQGVGTDPKAVNPEFILGGGTSSLLRCLNHNGGLMSTTLNIDGVDFSIRLSEGFQSAFANGTRFKITFHNVGAGVSLFIPAVVPLVAYRSEDLKSRTPNPKPVASGAPGFRPGRLILVSGAPRPTDSPSETAVAHLVGVPISKRTASAVYEVANTERSHLTGVIKKAAIDVYVAFIANTALNLPGLGHTSFSVAFAPRALAALNRFGFEITRNGFSIISCVQSLLFSFVTNRDGYDTTLTISNTSLDPMGTVTQAGTVTLNYYGSITGGQQAPSFQHSATVEPGKQLVFTLSEGGELGILPTPGFQGYIIATTRFQYAYGLAFINPIGGSTGHAHCYPAVRLKR